MEKTSDIDIMVWFFGRGASIACGLDWNEPQEWEKMQRDSRIIKIKRTLLEKMQMLPVGANPYSKLLITVEGVVSEKWKHFFITTNWDYLFQREIQEIPSIKLDKRCPSYLLNSRVFHLNGTVEQSPQTNRSPFLLPTDSPLLRRQSIETNLALQKILFEKTFIIIGMSFKCALDRALLDFLQIHGDNLPFGEGRWIIVQPSKTDLDSLSSYFCKKFPRATIVPIQQTFEEWLDAGLLELLNS